MHGCEALAESGKAKMKRRGKRQEETEKGTTTADNEKSGCECWKIGRICLFLQHQKENIR